MCEECRKASEFKICFDLAELNLGILTLNFETEEKKPYLIDLKLYYTT